MHAENHAIVSFLSNTGADTHETFEGIVYKKTLGHYFVRSNGRSVVCSISTLLRRQLIYPISKSLRPVVVDTADIHAVDPVAIGDEVGVTDAGDGTGMIRSVFPRRTKLSRLASGTKPLEQVVVANLHQVVPIFAAAQPSPKWAMLDRYLVTAEAAGVPALICITKMDLADEAAIRKDLRVYERIGYRVVYTSAETGTGIAELKDALTGKLSVLLGKSGVGKTSVLNAIQPELGLRVNAVSDSTGKGKHTTTHLEMFDLEVGGSVVDTPGMREFGLWDVDGTDLATLFPEMRPYLDKCRFGTSCQHVREPGCAVKDASDSGRISKGRYASYLKMR